jgi:hypothetical protein
MPAPAAFATLNNNGGQHEALVGSGGTDTLTDHNGTADFLWVGSNTESTAMLTGTTTGDTVLAATNGGGGVGPPGGTNTIVDASNGGHNTLMAGAGATAFFVNGTSSDTIYGNSQSQVVNSLDLSTNIASQVFNHNTGATTITMADGQVLRLVDISTVTFADGKTVSVTDTEAPRRRLS